MNAVIRRRPNLQIDIRDVLEKQSLEEYEKWLNVNTGKQISHILNRDSLRPPTQEEEPDPILLLEAFKSKSKSAMELQKVQNLKYSDQRLKKLKLVNDELVDESRKSV